MKDLILMAFRKGNAEITKRVLVFVILVLAWPVAQRLVWTVDGTAGYVDPGILILVLIGLICFMVLVGLCVWLMMGFLKFMGLPVLGDMVLRFKEMELWVQLGFYLACFALLLLAGVGTLAAVL
jgi:hypothetical protein